MTIKIDKIVGVRKLGDTTLTTAKFNDGGQILTATGIGEYELGEEVYLFMDDKHNRLKFSKKST